MPLSTTTEHHLSPSLATKADAIAARVSAVEKQMEEICMDVATDCENLEGETAAAYLKRALPQMERKQDRQRVLYAGLMLNEGKRRRLRLPAWSVAAEAYSLPPEDYDWFFAESRSRSEVRARKKAPTPKPKNDPVNPEQREVAEELQSVSADYERAAALLAQENAQLRKQLHELHHQAQRTQHHNDPTLGTPSDPEVLSTRVQMGEGPLGDFNYVLGLIDEISRIQGAYHRSGTGWTSSQWDSLLGHLEAISTPARCRGDYGKRSKSDAVINVRVSKSDSEA